MARKMKDSGIAWIGEIPEGWEVQRLKCFSSISSGEILSKDNYTSEGCIPVIGSNGKIGTTFKANVPSEVVTTGRVGTIGTTHIVKNVWVTDNALIIDSHNIDRRFLSYVIPNFDFNFMLSGTAQPLITATKLKNQFIPIPPTSQQISIADFLDIECSHIDVMLTKTRASIEAYKKLKQTVITQAVTKGVRGEREMKDSGVEWIGEIPKEWHAVKAKYCVEITHGSDPKAEGDVPVYGSGSESFKTCGEYKNGPAVLVGRKGATLHIPHYIQGKYWNVDTAFDVKSKDNFCLRYYYYLATSFDYKFYISQTTLPGMTQSNYYNMFLPFPALSEQEEISTYLDAKCAEIDRLIAKKEQLVKELESYKKSLIYEVVTGKREV